MRWLKNKKVIIQLFVGFVGLVLVGLVFFFNLLKSLPSPAEIAGLQVSQSTKIYDRTGDTLLYEIYGEEKRTIIAPSDIPDFVREATISIEDDSFYSHPAFDLRGIFRAVVRNIISGDPVGQGGSTITQQLAKNAFLTNEKTYTRKLKELFLAMRLEKYYTKDEILNLYLNQVPYGGNAYGIEAASQTFFGKSAKDLTLNEAALLAALPQSPTYYSPWGSHVDKLEARKNTVLKRMWELGYIDRAQYDEASSEMPDVIERPETGTLGLHFIIYIEDYLREKYGEDALRIDGLKVITTLDADMQKEAEDAVKAGVARDSELYGGENGALIALDPKTGQILAMVGSKDYSADPVPSGCTPGKDFKFEGNFNVAVQGLRQPGSSIKPIAYLTAMEEGFTPNTILWDVPTEFSPRCSAVVDFSNRSSLCYHPQNFDLTFRGPVTMQQALAQSINVPAVKTLYLAGLDNVIKMASRLGINTLNDPSRLGLSLVLGGGEVRLIDLAAAYAAIANDGVYREPTGVLRIEDSEGKTLEEYKDSSEQAVDPQYARIINDILSNVELRSGLFHASLGLTQVPGRQVALKTGTTNDYVDAWTFGYTPDLVAGVWVGNNDREPLTSHGSSILAAVPMWHDFFSKAVDKTPSSTFARPENTTSDVPALRGELSGDNLHNILYYLSRQSDPQFNNWEVGVQGWLQSHSVDLNRFKSADGAGDSGGGIKIAVSSPASGSFATDPLNLSFTVSSEKNIKGLEVYLNGRAIDSKEDLGKSFTYNKEVPADSLQLQNLITINVLDEGGSQAEERIIVFK